MEPSDFVKAAVFLRKFTDGRRGPLWAQNALLPFEEKHVAICTYSHVLQVNTHVTRCASLHCASQFRAV